MGLMTMVTTAGTLQHSRPRLATKEEAAGLDREATQIIKEMKRSWLSLGLVMKRVSETQAYEQLGFRSIRAWTESRLGEQMASAYQSMRALRALEGVPESKLERIGTRNAQVLVRLPEKERKSDQWIEKAAKLPERAYRELAADPGNLSDVSPVGIFVLSRNGVVMWDVRDQGPIKESALTP